ncbi:hypothetical protein ILUMI_23061 [Ignelater luminosus]|uniref:Dynein regulatory complex subunit 4 n=1 Tax=Ignelater luminosus TaxID=2038154 RepID=A0A8K0CFZ3_IGNLU|nr:hypothetical protein ILUMI_23061 [Ignelater luminosus]
MVSLKLAQDEHITQERELLRDKRELKKQLREQEISHQDQMKLLKLDEMEILRKQNEKMTKEVASLTAENHKLTEPLKQAQAEVEEYKKQLQNYKMDKLSLANIKAKLHDTKKELDKLRWSNEALELRFENLQAERDELHKKFVTTILEVQQKTSLKNALLQKRIQTLNDMAEYREAVIGELTAASEIPPQRVNKKLEEMLSNKNAIIKDLQYELERIGKAYNDVLEVYEEKLEQYGVPRQEIGFLPRSVVTEGPREVSKEGLQIVKKSK